MQFLYFVNNLTSPHRCTSNIFCIDLKILLEFFFNLSSPLAFFQALKLLFGMLDWKMASLAAASTNLATTSGITASAEMEAASVVIPSLPLMSDTEDAMVVEESSELGNTYFKKMLITFLVGIYSIRKIISFFFQMIQKHWIWAVMDWLS